MREEPPFAFTLLRHVGEFANAVAAPGGVAVILDPAAASTPSRGPTKRTLSMHE
jgi:hypothetical protein